jgi:hypothetical protein
MIEIIAYLSQNQCIGKMSPNPIELTFVPDTNDGFVNGGTQRCRRSPLVAPGAGREQPESIKGVVETMMRVDGRLEAGE